MIRAAILSLVLIMAGFSSASASECGKLCDPEWWKTATQEEVAAEIATVDVNSRDEDGLTPLHKAAALGTPANVALLLKAGANVNARTEDGETPLCKAVFFNTVTSRVAANIPILLKAGADVNPRAENGRTPLHWAASRGTPADVAVLLDAGADVKIQDDYNATPFDRAKDNEKLKGSDAYWRLNDARFD